MGRSSLARSLARRFPVRRCDTLELLGDRKVGKRPFAGPDTIFLTPIFDWNHVFCCVFGTFAVV